MDEQAGGDNPALYVALRRRPALAAAQRRGARFVAQFGCQERIMLIHKGNFLYFKLLCSSLLGLLLACLLAGPAEAAPPRRAAQAAPDAVAAEFYGWYLDALSADQDPLSDRYATFVRYVARPLAARLVERLKSGPPPDGDYFIQAAGVRQAWLHGVQARLVRQRGDTAEVHVTLGQDERTRRVLALTMVREEGAWKIRTVGLVGNDVFKSSAEQLVI
jgi:hypothetical protein